MSSSVSSTPPDVPWSDLLIITSSAEQSVVLRLHPHGVDSQLAPVVSLDHDDLKQVGGAVGAQVQRSPRGLVLADLPLVEAVGNGVPDVSVRHAVSPRRRVYLHSTSISYYE